MNFQQFKALTFDCYGTLIDWESGICGALRPILKRHGVRLSDAEIREHYGRFEAAEQMGEYNRYRNILVDVTFRFGLEFGFRPTPEETAALVKSLPNWQPFPDTGEALQRLKQRFKLVIVSNIDDDLFAATAKHLPVEFDAVITAQQVGSYKPSHANFETALQRIGLPKEQVLHVAQSLYHDIVPAKALGIANVWVNRSGGVVGTQVDIQPDLEVPDLKTLADKVEEQE